MKGAVLAEEEAELALPPSLVVHPASAARKKQAESEPKFNFPNIATRTDRRDRI
jgi:hypothetical protein